MSVATEFPLPRLDRFEWEEMKLGNLTGKHRLSLLIAYTSGSMCCFLRNIPTNESTEYSEV